MVLKTTLTRIIWLFSLTASLSAAALESPTSHVVLTISGDIKHTNSAAGAEFDLAMLHTLPRKSIVTHDPWSDGVHTYSGFDLYELLRSLDNHGNMLRLTALNYYIVEIPVEDFITKGAIIATHKDGLQMSVRNLGPTMVIYPFDDDQSLRNELYYGRSIWQIQNITSFTID
ncbi:putative pterin-binding protein [Marinomonas epiphytica]